MLLLLIKHPASRVHGHVLSEGFVYISNEIRTFPGVHGEYIDFNVRVTFIFVRFCEIECMGMSFLKVLFLFPMKY